jgi:hypothetical protein
MKIVKPNFDVIIELKGGRKEWSEYMRIYMARR